MTRAYAFSGGRTFKNSESDRRGLYRWAELHPGGSILLEPVVGPSDMALPRLLCEDGVPLSLEP